MLAAKPLHCAKCNSQEAAMHQRIDYRKIAPQATQAMLQLQAYVNKCGLEPLLMELVKIRASQINGCAFCLHMHTRDARKLGEREERIYLLDAWRESSFYTERERAALEWTEALTLVSEGGVPDDVFNAVRGQFSDQEMVDLTMAVVAINGWNRISIGFAVPHPAPAIVA
jgi:AhpD family alkylhydroperoxidase